MTNSSFKTWLWEEIKKTVAKLFELKRLRYVLSFFILLSLLLIVSMAVKSCNNNENDEYNQQARSISQEELDSIARTIKRESPEYIKAKKEVDKAAVYVEQMVQGKKLLDEVNKELYELLRAKGLSHEEAIDFIRKGGR